MMIRNLFVPAMACLLTVLPGLRAAPTEAPKDAPQPKAKEKPAPQAPAELPRDVGILKTLHAPHPRLMLRQDALEQLKKTVQADPDAAAMFKHLRAGADACLDREDLKHKLVGPRLLFVSRDCLRRVYALALAWRLTGKAAYADRCIRDLLTVCEFPDWNPRHFLDTAEMTHAVAVGYDWLYDRLDAPQREKIRSAIIRLGLEPGLKVYRTAGWWVADTHNWNQVCNAGMIIGSLALADTDPQYAQQILPAALKSMPRALATYAPDGAWPEGPGYWGYATAYTTYGLAALESALGSDLGLGRHEGLDVTGLFPLYAAGPTGLFFNYADSGERNRRRPLPCLFYLARKYQTPGLAWAEHAAVRQHQASDPLHLVWYVPRPAAPPPQLLLDKQFRGPVELAFFRSSWEGDALFAAFKAGYNQVNHSHLDLGCFEMDALGQRWARDLGSDDYNLPGYWGSGRGGSRWKYYRLGSLSHNLPLLDGQHQDPLARSRMTLFRSTPEFPRAIVDFTSAYPQAAKARRGLALVQDRRSLLVQDEFELTSPVQVEWGFATDADVQAQGPLATLRLHGKQLRAHILEPAGAAWTVESAQQKEPQRPNTDVRRLLFRLRDQKGPLRMAVLLAPVWNDAKPANPPALTDLAQW